MGGLFANKPDCRTVSFADDTLPCLGTRPLCLDQRLAINREETVSHYEVPRNVENLQKVGDPSGEPTVSSVMEKRSQCAMHVVKPFACGLQFADMPQTRKCQKIFGALVEEAQRVSDFNWVYFLIVGREFTPLKRPREN